MQQIHEIINFDDCIQTNISPAWKASSSISQWRLSRHSGGPKMRGKLQTCPEKKKWKVAKMLLDLSLGPDSFIEVYGGCTEKPNISTSCDFWWRNACFGRTCLVWSWCYQPCQSFGERNQVLFFSVHLPKTAESSCKVRFSDVTSLPSFSASLDSSAPCFIFLRYFKSCTSTFTFTAVLHIYIRKFQREMCCTKA